MELQRVAVTQDQDQRYYEYCELEYPIQTYRRLPSIYAHCENGEHICLNLLSYYLLMISDLVWNDLPSSDVMPRDYDMGTRMSNAAS